MNNKGKSLSYFVASFKQGFQSPNVPLITVHQDGKEFIFVLDTGSEHNVVDKKSLENIKYTLIQDEDMPHTLAGVGGKAVDISACSIDFKCGDENYSLKFVINDMSEALSVMKEETGIVVCGLIGSKFLKENDIILDFKNYAAYSRK